MALGGSLVSSVTVAVCMLPMVMFAEPSLATVAPGYKSTPTFRAASLGSSVLSTVPKGVSTCTLPSCSRTCIRCRARRTINAHVPILRIPRPTITASTIRIILRAPPPCAGPAGAAETGEAFDAAPAAVDDAAPHLGQNFAPASIAVPHELQNAISHLVGEFVTGAGVYSKLAQDAA